MSKPCVAILAPTRSALGGVSTHLKLLSASQTALDVELIHFTVGSQGRSESTVARVLRLIASPLLFCVFLLTKRPSIVHLNTSLDPKAYWRDAAHVLVARLLRRKIVYQVHGGALPADFFPRSRVLQGLLRRVLTLPDAIVLLAQEELVAYRQFVPNARLTVIPNAIDVAELQPVPKQGAPAETLEILFMSRLEVAKGVFELLDAMRMLRDRGIGVRLSVVGEGSAEKAMRAAVAEAGLQDRVHFLGMLLGDSKSQALQRAEVFVLPTYKEGLPYALLEAMAFGLVPVTTAVAAIPDVVHHGVHGLLIQPRDATAIADAIERLHRNRPEVVQMGAASARRIADHYTVPRLTRDFRELYRTL